MRPSEVFVAQVRIQRERKAWSQSRLATRLARLGFPVHQTTVGKWEAGERRVMLDEALAICVALDVCPMHMIAGSYLGPSVDDASIALSPITPPVTPRQMRLWLRGLQPLWGQDEKRYTTEVAPDEWAAMQRAGVNELLRSVNELVEAWGRRDRAAAVEIIESIHDELERQRRALEREPSKRVPQVSSEEGDEPSEE
jgi:hypothetical protein